MRCLALEAGKAATCPTPGWSEEARFVTRGQIELRNRMEEAFSLMFAIRRVREELRAIAADCSRPGWNGDQSQPVHPVSITKAEQLLDSQPQDLPPPSVGVDPDGQITCEWYRNPRRVVSLSVDPKGYLHYAALLGSRRSYGTEPFGCDLPPILLDLIRRVIRP